MIKAKEIFMDDLLFKVHPPKFIRYLFFIAYCWYRRFSIERYNAHHTAILIISIGFLIIYMSLLLPFLINGNNKILILLPIFLLVFGQFYIWFWYKDKWKIYIDEFKHVNVKRQKWGLIYLFIYLILCYYVGIELIMIKNILNLNT